MYTAQYTTFMTHFRLSGTTLSYYDDVSVREQMFKFVVDISTCSFNTLVLGF